MSYASRHWQGKFSLGLSFWINLVLISTIFRIVIISLEDIILQYSIRTRASLILFLVAMSWVLGIWQWVGTWRSAHRTSIEENRTLWPAIVKFLIVIGVLVSLGQSVALVRDSLKLLAALDDPNLSEYEVTTIGGTDLILIGAINDKSVSDIIRSFSDNILILRVNSHGGVIEPALRLASFISERHILVMAEGNCLSACVLLLAASPNAAISIGTEVGFHAVSPLADFTTAEFQSAGQQASMAVEKALREYGIDQWALKLARGKEFWYPTINELVNMDLVHFIFDSNQMTFIEGAEYCKNHPAVCDN